MINLDPQLVNQDDIRKKRRRKYLKIIAAPCVVWLVFALFSLRQPIYNIFFGLALRNNDLKLARTLTQFQFAINVAQPEIAYYNRGIVNLKSQQAQAAEQDFNESIIRDSTHKNTCASRINLSLSIELQANEKLYAGDFDQAISLYTRAETSLPPSANSGIRSFECSPKQDQKIANSKIRLRQGRRQTIAHRNEVIESLDSNANDEIVVVDPQMLDTLQQEQQKNNLEVGKIRNDLSQDRFRAKPQ